MDAIGLIGIAAFGVSGVLTYLHDASIAFALLRLRECPVFYAVLQPADVQPWLSLVNTAALTFGTTLLVLRQRWLKSNAEDLSEGIRRDLSDSQKDAKAIQERNIAEREALRKQVQAIQARLSAAFDFIALYRKVIQSDREWMRRVAEKHQESLPDGFSHREFDDIPDAEWERFLHAVAPPDCPNPDCPNPDR